MKRILLLIFSMVMALLLCFGMASCNCSGKVIDDITKKLENEFGAVLEGKGLEDLTFITEALGADAEMREEVLDILSESGIELDGKALAVLDLALMSGDVKVQPGEKVTVTIPAFLEDITEYDVFHILDDGTIEELVAEYTDGKIVFETSSFSYFIVTTKNVFNATAYYKNHTFSNINDWVTVGKEYGVEDAYEMEQPRTLKVNICREEFLYQEAMSDMVIVNGLPYQDFNQEGREFIYGEFVDLNRLGAVVTKGVANIPWPGNPTPRVAEVYGGMLNAIGLQNPGIEVFCERDIPFLKQYDTKIIVNVCGKSVEDYLEVVDRLGHEDIAMMEINVSCPNVKEGAIAFGQKADALYNITSEIKKRAKQPIIMKLSPNVTDITEMAKAAEAAGADAISLINTLTGMKIDIHRRKFALANKTGGMSGPAIKPVAVRMVYQAAHAVKIPVIGMGGIATAEDAIEFILAGATAVSVGAMNFVNPYTTIEVIEGIENYMRTYGVTDIKDLICAVNE
jgi:dihydroorotate dehydrogenase (NAD+) catalytic subunit